MTIGKSRHSLLPLRALAHLCEKYLDYYNGFSYDFYKNGQYELLKRLSKLPFLVIFDVGSNVGDWSAIASALFPQATIHAFELSTGTFQTLLKRLPADHFVANNIGLSDHRGTVVYKDHGKDSVVNTLLLDSTYHEALRPTLIEARVDAGDMYCADHGIAHIDLLKIDVEGAEHLVLKGFSEMLQKQAIRVIEFEYGYANGDAHFLMRDFFNLFERFGYQVGRITRHPIEFSKWTYANNGFKSGPNYVAIRQGDAEVMAALSSHPGAPRHSPR